MSTAAAVPTILGVVPLGASDDDDHGVNVALGLRNGIASERGQVNTATAGLVGMPRQASFGGVAPVVQISVSGSDNLTRAVVGMIDVRVNDSIAKLGQAFDKAGRQPA